MKRRYMFIILGILLTGTAIIIYFNQTSTSVEETIDNATQEKQNDETNESENESQDQEESQQDDTSAESVDKPVTQLQEILNTAVQHTIDFFTNQETHITAIGDSLTQGVGDDVVEGGYVGILDNQINESSQVVSFDNYGKRGNRSIQLLERLDNPEIEQSIKDSDMVLITIGANDIMQVVKENFTNLKVDDFTTAQSQYENNLQRIFDKINDLNSDSKVYLLGVYNPFSNYFQDIEELNMIVSDWNEASQDMTDKYDNMTFIPIADLFDGKEDDLFADDNFHPNHRGYQHFAQRVLEYVTDQ